MLSLGADGVDGAKGDKGDVADVRLLINHSLGHLYMPIFTEFGERQHGHHWHVIARQPW